MMTGMKRIQDTYVRACPEKEQRRRRRRRELAELSHWSPRTGGNNRNQRKKQWRQEGGGQVSNLNEVWEERESLMNMENVLRRGCTLRVQNKAELKRDKLPQSDNRDTSPGCSRQDTFRASRWTREILSPTNEEKTKKEANNKETRQSKQILIEQTPGCKRRREARSVPTNGGETLWHISDYCLASEHHSILDYCLVSFITQFYLAIRISDYCLAL